MIRVTIELVPLGDEKRTKQLGSASIYNDGSGTHLEGTYKVVLYKWGEKGRIWKKGEVKGFARKRLGPWDLLYQALKATVGERA